jgi:hypothetical protein
MEGQLCIYFTLLVLNILSKYEMGKGLFILNYTLSVP